MFNDTRYTEMLMQSQQQVAVRDAYSICIVYSAAAMGDHAYSDRLVHCAVGVGA